MTVLIYINIVLDSLIRLSMLLLLIICIVYSFVIADEKRKAVNEFVTISKRLSILMDIPIKKAREFMKGEDKRE